MNTTQSIEYRLVSTLVPSARNARTHNARQLAQIKALILEYGWTNPVLADAEGIVAGHGRVLAAADLYAGGAVIRLPSGDTLPAGTVPVLDCTGWSNPQRRAYVIADNAVALQAGWDESLLRLELADLSAEGIDLGLLAFDPAELQGYFGTPGAAGNAPGPTLADRFLLPPFTVLNAREGWWQERKAQWLALGIRSELGRGDAPPGGSALPLVHGADGAMEARGRTAPGGSPRPAADYSERERGDGAGRPMKGKKGGAKMHLPSHGPTVTQGADGKLEYRGAARKDWGRTFGQDLMRGEHVVGERDTLPAGVTFGEMQNFEGAGRSITGTSIFDPVLCEIAYRWFSPPQAVVLDPFAGGSVRGIVASRLGRRYVGVELRGEQVAANEAQRALCRPDDPAPAWREGDSAVVDLEDIDADLVFTCPPYADLEVYSDDPRDISNMPWPDFLAAYRRIIARACARLRPDRFAAVVIGEVRDPHGAYRNLVGETVEAFRAAGLAFYNEAILVTAAGSLPIRAAKQFSTTRKLGKTHQNVLVFVKGDPRVATQACGTVDVSDAIAQAAGDVETPPHAADAEYGERL